MIKKILSFSLIILFSMDVFAYSSIQQAETEEEKKAKINRQPAIDKSKTHHTKTYKDKTNSEDYNQWTAQDWAGQLPQENGSSITNAKTLFSDDDVTRKAYSANPNSVNSQNLQNEPNIKIWDTQLQDGLIANTTSSGSKKNIEIDSTVKCYVSRDLGIRYKCSYNNLTISKEIDSSGLEAKNLCEQNCVEEQNCVGLVSNPVVNIVTLANVSLKDVNTLLEKNYEKEISSDVILDKIEFKIKISKKEDVEMDASDVYGTLSLSVFDFETEIGIVKDLQFVKTDLYDEDKEYEQVSYKVGEPTDKISLKIVRPSGNVNIEITEFKAIYKINSRYVCRDQQDIADILPTEFGYKCPSGNLVTFNIGLDQIKICADYGIRGDNRDGTFSDQESCNSICKKQHQCELDVRITDTASLQEFREGCIQGEPGCSANPDICKELRVSGATILNENVFNARQEVTQTIVNSAQLQGVTRPRLLLKEDIDHQTRMAEEWKDEGYEHMLKEGNFKTTKKIISDNTEASNGYAYGIDEVGENGLPVRGLYWILKPRAFDVNAGEFYFYSILEVILEKYKLNAEGVRTKVKDRVLYIKTGDRDYYKPFARQDNYAVNVVVDGKYENSKNDNAVWKYKTYMSGVWVALSPSIQAEHFKKETIVLNEPFLRISVIKNIRNLIFNLRGVAKKILRLGPLETKLFEGEFDGTGETVGKYTQYVMYTKTPLTYQAIFNKIQNSEISPIYDNISSSIYARDVKNDNGDRQSNINTYLYGKEDSKSAYIRIFPKQQEVDKKAFIYIFAY